MVISYSVWKTRCFVNGIRAAVSGVRCLVLKQPAVWYKKETIMKSVLYFLVTVVATSAGGVSGMGGGIMIKPALDFMGGLTPAVIGVMSSATVLVMSVISTWRNVKNGIEIEKNVAVPVALGSVTGGLVGQQIFSIIAGAFDSAVVTRVQNIILFMVVAAILFYMKNKGKIKSRNVKGVAPVFLSGLILGIIASFLGIGGGPMNVAVFIYLFSYSTKSAAACSLITVLFSQIAKLSLAGIGGNFSEVELKLLVPMLVGAVMGGFISGAVVKRLSDRGIDIVFNTIQVVVLTMCIVNIVMA